MYRWTGRRHTGHCRCRAGRGFTLLELMVALLIATLIITTVPPLFTGSLSGTETRVAARKLAAGLRHVRSQAIATQRDAALELDLEQRRYRTSGGRNDIQLASGIALTLTTALREVSGPDRASIRFFPDGSSTGGRIEIADDKRRYVVDVDWLTGRIDLHD